MKVVKYIKQIEIKKYDRLYRLNLPAYIGRFFEKADVKYVYLFEYEDMFFFIGDKYLPEAFGKIVEVEKKIDEMRRDGIWEVDRKEVKE